MRRLPRRDPNRTDKPLPAAAVNLPDGDDLVVVPANAGAARPPAWWLNLRAAGEGVAVVNGRRHSVVVLHPTSAPLPRTSP